MRTIILIGANIAMMEAVIKAEIHERSNAQVEILVVGDIMDQVPRNIDPEAVQEALELMNPPYMITDIPRFEDYSIHHLTNKKMRHPILQDKRTSKAKFSNRSHLHKHLRYRKTQSKK